MRRRLAVLLMLISLCAVSFSAQAAQKISIYIDKDALLAHKVTASDVNIRPEGMVRVVRYSLWPWDDESSRWSLFVEIENASDEKIVIDDNWLAACRQSGDEIATAEFAFERISNVIMPGERTVLHAGVYPYVRGKRINADASVDAWDVYGMEDFADRIRQAEMLSVGLSVRGNESSQERLRVDIEPEIRCEGNSVRFAWFNDMEDMLDFYTIGAVMYDAQGRMIDIIRLTYSRGATAAPGEWLRFEKKLAPYITQEQIKGASFKAFAYRMKAN